MANPLFNLLGGASSVPSNIQNMIARFQQFKQACHGDPQAQIQQLLNSGAVSQEQYNRAVQMANELQKYLR